MKCKKCNKLVDTAFELTYSTKQYTIRLIICEECFKAGTVLNVAMIRFIDLRKIAKER